MRCPDSNCALEIGSLPCLYCEERLKRAESEMEKLVTEFSLIRGFPNEPERRHSFDAADSAFRRHLGSAGFEGEVSYKQDAVMESALWWYIPFYWIGCAGFIVEKADGAVNWLGSAHPLRLCFWAHNRGLWARTTDITIHLMSKTPETRELVLELVRVGPKGIFDRELAELEVDRLYSNLPAQLNRKDIWLFIDRIESRVAKGEFEFTAEPCHR